MLNDCKNCGTSNPVTTDDHEVFSIGCKVCLSSSQAKETEEEAIQNWNENNS